jgi:serine/threonine-protein phosphatase 6 regulatory ankyrin repeat subunit B
MGAAVNGAQADGATALMAAAQNDHRPIVQALLARGARPNTEAPDGVTALMLASVQGHGAVVQALLAQGAQ